MKPADIVALFYALAELVSLIIQSDPDAKPATAIKRHARRVEAEQRAISRAKRKHAERKG